MIKAFRVSNFSDADCGAHKINLVVRNSLFKSPEVKEVLQKCRKLVGHFNHSNLAYDRLEDEQIKEQLSVRKLIQDVDTRWNSTFMMCERLVEQRKAIQVYLTRYDNRTLDLNENEWKLISKFKMLLQPIDEVSRMLCEDMAPISLQIPLAKMLYFSISTAEIPKEFVIVCTKMREVLKNKFFDLEKDKLHALAIFLDPRFKHRMATDKDEFCQDVEQWISEALDKEDLKIREEPIRKKPRNEPTSSGSLFDLHAGLIGNHQEHEPANDFSLLHELLEYKAELCIPLKADPLVYWKNRSSKFPILARFAAQFLSAPATSVASEQIFSAARNVYDHLRCKLLLKNAEMLIFLHVILPVINYQY